MAEVTGPIRSLPGAGHDFPDGTVCDRHPDRPAVARIQGETDSFGAELNDLCRECLEADRAYARSPEARSGTCDWCKGEATDLSWRRDHEEGPAGRVYRVCGACRKRDDDYWESQLDYDGDIHVDDEPFDDEAA